jgi:hypothetical protein
MAFGSILAPFEITRGLMGEETGGLPSSRGCFLRTEELDPLFDLAGF